MPDWLMQAAALVGAGVGVYVAIRADLARLHERVARALDESSAAHRRIDGMLGVKS